MSFIDYIYYVKYYLIPNGRLVDRLPICMNDVDDMQD